MTSTLPAAGLPSTIRDATAAQPDLALHAGAPAGDWTDCADLLDGDRLAAWTERAADWLRAGYGEAPARVVAGYLVGWYLTVPAKTGALLFRTARRVPLLGPADLAVRFDADAPGPAAVAVLRDEYACLPTDPAAGLPAARPMPDERTLAAVLRERYTAHATVFLRAFTAVDTPALGRHRLGRHALWAWATDALDGACWRVGQSLDDEAGGARDAALVLPARIAPLTSASTLRPDTRAGGWTRRRESCCFHYVLERGMGTCATCPRVCTQEIHR
ncbi:MAG TPA: (2Fe-2S)-binding protein [Pseudonocardiaceae bacterium]|nr:(2Fe-2S)-binding protein [Pseudonocardiaceae bacterium]